MPDYQKSKIYAIKSYQTEMMYIGSTTQTLSQRIGKHKENYIKNGTTSSKQILKYEDYYIELIENFPCNTKEELLKREGFHIRENINICVNCNIAGRTIQEYRQDNVDKIKETSKQYYQDNVEKMKEQKKQYRQNNSEQIKEYTKQYKKDNKDKIKQYYQDNVDKIKETRKQYYQANKDIILEKQKAYYELKKNNSKSIEISTD